MRKRKSSVKKIKCALDRLSELPDSLILSILMLLPMREVVRTTILSTRWKNLWTTVPYLNFLYYDKMIDTDKVRKFIHGALNSWRGIKIEKLNFIIVSKFEKSDIDSWLHYALEKKVEELVLILPDLYLVPQYLYSCSSLKTLMLKNCDLQIHSNVEWNKLKKLRILSDGINQNAINHILCGSPLLEDFHITLGHSKENLSIRSTTLKTLLIFKRLFVPPSKDSELRIWTPNLKTFRCLGAPYSKCFLMDVSSLNEAVFKLHRPPMGTRFFGVSLNDDALGQILPTIKHVKRVTLSEWSIERLGALKAKLSPFHNVEFLELNNVCCENYEQIVSVLEMFPKLRNLVLQATYNSLLQQAESCLKFDRDLPDSFLLELRTVDVTLTAGDVSIVPLIQILLKCARNLQKMVFWNKSIETRSPWKSLFLVSQKLLRMQISSPTAELIFC